MRSIKLLAVALMLALAGFVYAWGQTQDSKMACGEDKAGCCATAECCKAGGDSCCKAHKMGNQQAAQDKQKSCCEGCANCKDGKSCAEGCCKTDKTGKAASAGCCDTSKEGGCCGGGCACNAKDKAKTS